jgi:hypothetical protein
MALLSGADFRDIRMRELLHGLVVAARATVQF